MTYDDLHSLNPSDLLAVLRRQVEYAIDTLPTLPTLHPDVMLDNLSAIAPPTLLYLGDFEIRARFYKTDRPIPVLYDELLFAVAQKFPGETRHQTALRYIREAESRGVEGPVKETFPFSTPNPK
jgi:hypothetical protein